MHCLSEEQETTGGDRNVLDLVTVEGEFEREPNGGRSTVRVTEHLMAIAVILHVQPVPVHGARLVDVGHVIVRVMIREVRDRVVLIELFKLLIADLLRKLRHVGRVERFDELVDQILRIIGLPSGALKRRVWRVVGEQVVVRVRPANAGVETYKCDRSLGAR